MTTASRTSPSAESPDAQRNAEQREQIIALTAQKLSAMKMELPA